LLATVFKGPIDLTLDLIIDSARKTDVARFGHSLQTSRYVYAVAVDVAVRRDQDVAEVYSNAETESFQFRISETPKLLSDFEGGPNGLDRTCKLGKEPISRRLDQPSLMFGQSGLDYVSAKRIDLSISSLFVSLHHRRETYDVGGEDGSKAARGEVHRAQSAAVVQWIIGRAWYRGHHVSIIVSHNIRKVFSRRVCWGGSHRSPAYTKIEPSSIPLLRDHGDTS
jgi:hypothetical protein